MSAETLAIVLGGLVAMFLVQLFKRIGIADRIALWVTYVVSVVLAALIWLLKGGSLEPDALVVAGGAIMGYSQIIWRQFVKAREGANPLDATSEPP